MLRGTHPFVGRCSCEGSRGAPDRGERSREDVGPGASDAELPQVRRRVPGPRDWRLAFRVSRKVT